MSSKTVCVPEHRHHKGSGQAFVQIKGQRYYLGKWNTSASKERYAAFIAELAVSPIPCPLPLATPVPQLTVLHEEGEDVTGTVPISDVRSPLARLRTVLPNLNKMFEKQGIMHTFRRSC
jgi:hypothetical protein